MIKTLYIPNDINGLLCLHAFPFIVAANTDISIHEELSVSLNGNFMGYAKIQSVKMQTFGSISANQAFLFCKNNTAYAKSVLASYMGFSRNNPPQPEFPISFGIAEWLERHLEQHELLFQKLWREAQDKRTIAEHKPSLFNL